MGRPLDREHELEAVDLVVLRPDLLEPDPAHDRKGRRVAGRDAGVDLALTLRESPLDQRARRFFGKALTPERCEDRVTDFRSADHVGGSVKAAMPDDGCRTGDHQARHPLAAIRGLLHAPELDGEESGDILRGWKLVRHGEAQQALRRLASPGHQMADGIGFEGYEIEALSPNWANRHCRLERSARLGVS